MRFKVPALLVGFALGAVLAVLYGWVARPLEYVDTTPDSLRADFRTDYVLMVSEAYEGDGDLNLAQVRLAALGPRPVVDYAGEAIEYGLANEFPEPELDRLVALVDGLRELPQPGEIAPP